MRKTVLVAALAACTGLSACATVEETAVQATSKTFHANLTGAQETAGGDPDGSAVAEVSVSDSLDQVCYNVHDIRGIGEVTAAHIHRGAAGEDGNPVITLTKAHEGTFRGCDKAPDWLQTALQADFTGYYVNVHTSDYPKGAIRGQLGR